MKFLNKEIEHNEYYWLSNSNFRVLARARIEKPQDIEILHFMVMGQSKPIGTNNIKYITNMNLKKECILDKIKRMLGL